MQEVYITSYNTLVMTYCNLIVVLYFADERDRVQKKTFTKWVNKHLIKVMAIDNHCRQKTCTYTQIRSSL